MSYSRNCTQEESKISIPTIFLGGLFCAMLIACSPLLGSATTTSKITPLDGQHLTAATETKSIRQTKTFLFLGNKNIAPVIFLEGAAPAGLAVDIVREIAKHIPEPIEIRAMDWTEAQTLVASGEADALIQINANEARRKIFDFSDPLLESHFSIFTTANRVDISSITSLRGKRVGVEASGLPHQILSSDPQIELTIVPNFFEAFSQLKSGSIDAVVVDYRVGSYTLATNNIQGVKVVGTPIASSYSSFAVKKDNIQLLNKINNALRIIKVDGSYQRIVDKWRPTEVVFLTQEKITDYEHYVIILVLFVAMLITGIWSLLLRKELRRRKIAEIAEQRAEKYAEKLISAANAMIVCLDKDGKITLLNEEGEKITGYKKEEVLDKNWFEIIVPRSRWPEAWKIFETFRAQGKSIQGEFQNPILTKSGEEKLIDWRNSDLREGDVIVGTISYGIDVTQQKQAERERIESEEKFAAAFSASPDLMAITRIADGLIVEINQGYTQMLGYTRNESIGKTTKELGIWADETDRATFIAKLQEDGQALDFETKLRRKDGSLVTVIDSARIFDLQGESCVLSTAHDISDRKRSEQELMRMNRALTILSSTNQVLIHTKDEKLLLNDICQIITNIGKYELMWIGFAEQDEKKTIHAAAQSGFSEEHLKFSDITWADDKHGQGPTSIAIRTGKTQVVHDIQDNPKVTPWRQLAVERGCKSLIALPLASDGQTFGVVNIYSGDVDAFDKPEVKILEELTSDLAFGIMTLRLQVRVEERTKEVDQLKNQFIHIVSHQLNTPLNIIRWSLETILERKRGEIPVAILELLKGTYAANLEVISRIDDLLTAINIEEGQIRLSRDSVNINDLFHSLCEEKLQVSRLKNITHEIIGPPEPIPSIEADAEKIRDVVTRLISNAITYTHNGGHIAVKFFKSEHNIRFEIIDNGIGIPIYEQPRIFERFHRGWNAAQMKPDASGLGLYIAKKYIEIHGGKIGFTTEENKGSTFWFELPTTE